MPTGRRNKSRFRTHARHITSMSGHPNPRAMYLPATNGESPCRIVIRYGRCRDIVRRSKRSRLQKVSILHSPSRFNLTNFQGGGDDGVGPSFHHRKDSRSLLVGGVRIVRPLPNSLITLSSLLRLYSRCTVPDPRTAPALLRL